MNLLAVPISGAASSVVRCSALCGVPVCSRKSNTPVALTAASIAPPSRAQNLSEDRSVTVAYRQLVIVVSTSVQRETDI